MRLGSTPDSPASTKVDVRTLTFPTKQAFHLAKIFGHKVKKIFVNKRPSQPSAPSIAEESTGGEEAAEATGSVDIHAAAHATLGQLTAHERGHYLEIAEVLSSKSAAEVDAYWEEVRG